MKNSIIKYIVAVLIMLISTATISAKTITDDIYNTVEEHHSPSVPLAVTFGPMGQIINNDYYYGASASLTVVNLYISVGCVGSQIEGNNQTQAIANFGYSMKANDKISVIPNFGVAILNSDCTLNYGCVFRYNFVDNFLLDFNIGNNFLGIGFGYKFN